MKLAALISGGKDSIYSAYKASKENEIVCLISFKSKRDDSYMFHIPNIHLVELQAKSMNLPLIFMESSGVKEKELKDIEKSLKTAIKKYDIKGVVSGALASNYQKERIDKICDKLKIKSIAPLWHIDPKKYLKELIKNNFKVIIVGIAAEGFDKSWLGREINTRAFEELKILNEKIKFHLGFEGGEAETLVLDCPLFSKKLKIKKSKIEMENNCTGKFIVEDAELVKK
jgi:diphthine-ammonia ligase